ncbi:1778_t:CDS:2, partial [Acaulospora colombiana]
GVVTPIYTRTPLRQLGWLWLHRDLEAASSGVDAGECSPERPLIKLPSTKIMVGAYAILKLSKIFAAVSLTALACRSNIPYRNRGYGGEDTVTLRYAVCVFPPFTASLFGGSMGIALGDHIVDRQVQFRVLRTASLRERERETPQRGRGKGPRS